MNRNDVVTGVMLVLMFCCLFGVFYFGAELLRCR
jgi:preprotein translocase subunit SecE